MKYAYMLRHAVAMWLFLAEITLLAQIGHSDTTNTFSKDHFVRSTRRSIRLEFHGKDSTYSWFNVYHRSGWSARTHTGQFKFRGDRLVLFTDNGATFKRFRYSRRYSHSPEGNGWTKEYLQPSTGIGRRFRTWPGK